MYPLFLVWSKQGTCGNRLWPNPHRSQKQAQRPSQTNPTIVQYRRQFPVPVRGLIGGQQDARLTLRYRCLLAVVLLFLTCVNEDVLPRIIFVYMYDLFVYMYDLFGYSTCMIFWSGRPNP